MRRQPRLRLLAVIVLIGAVVAGTSLARDILQGDNCLIDEGETSDGTLFVLCENLTIRGQVQGSVVGAALRTEITGRVDGSVYLLGGQLDVTGELMRDLHYIGPVLRIAPPLNEAPDEPSQAEARSPQLRLRGSVISATLSTTVGQGAVIPGSILSFGYQLLVHGEVNDEISFWGAALVIDGVVRDNVYATVGNPENDSSQIETLLLPLSLDLQLRNPGLVLAEDGLITGSLNYEGPVAGRIDGTVRQQQTFRPYQSVTLPTLEEPDTVRIFISRLIQEASTLLAVGLMILLVLPELLREPLSNMRRRPFASFSVGMLSFILSFPIALIALVLGIVVVLVLLVLGMSGVATVAGVTLGLLAFGGIGIFYFVAIFVARMLVGLAIGRLVLRLIVGQDDSHRLMVIALVIGVLLFALGASLPVVGVLLNAAALFLGLGTILMILLENARKLRDTGGTPAPAWYHPEAPVVGARGPAPSLPLLQSIEMPPPGDIEEARPPRVMPPPGMENLPEGFDPSFFQDDEETEE